MTLVSWIPGLGLDRLCLKERMDAGLN